MESFALGMALALWFGILTSISPCPLATNIAAISYIGRRVDRADYILSAGFLYMLGRTITYVLLGFILISSVQMMPLVANFLQKYMNIILGPFLIVIGLILFEVITIPLGNIGLPGNYLKPHIDRAGILGAGFLGIIFALSFCPVSAALFFGSLFSLAIKHGSKIILPSIFGIGTAIPVLAMAFLLAFTTHYLGTAYQKITVFESWARRVTATVFIVAGIFYCSKYIVHWI